MPPAVRVGVLVLLAVQQHPTLLQQFDDAGIGFHHVLAGKVLGFRQEHAVASHRIVDIQLVLLAHHEVILAVSRGSVHRAGTGFSGDVIAENDRHLPLQEAVLQQLIFQRSALAATQHLDLFQAEAPGTGLSQLLGQQQCPALPFDQHIIQLRMQAHRHIGRQCPGCGGPDRHRDLTAVVGATGGIESGGVHCGKRHIDGGGVLVLILHLGLGQGRTAVHAPMHWLEALVHMAVIDNTRQRAHDIGLELEVHGQVGIEPVPDDTHADKIGTLAIDLSGSVVTAFFAKLLRAHLDARFTHLLLDIEFNGQAVTVPARHIGGIEARQGPRLDDNILEDLVDGMAQVQFTVGIGGAIVQDEFRATGAGLADFLIQVHVLPFFQSLGFPLGQAGFHGEGRFRQVQCVFVITHMSVNDTLPAGTRPVSYRCPLQCFVSVLPLNRISVLPAVCAGNSLQCAGHTALFPGREGALPDWP